MAKNSPNVPNTAHPAASGPGGEGGIDDPCSQPGGTGTECSEQQCIVTSQTEQTSPGERSRTRIGVGERVTLTVDPSPGEWSVTGRGTLSPTSGASVTLTAGDQAGQATVTAEAGGRTCTKEFEVVAPSGISLQREDARGFYHDHGNPSAGFVGRVHILPDDVNFDAVEYKEEDVQATATGGCSFMAGQGHHPNTSWLPVSETVIAGRGSRGGIDEVRVRMTITGTVPAGTVTWAIPWRYRVRGGSRHSIGTFNQVVDMSANGSVTITKGGASVTKAKNDPSSTMDTTPPDIEEDDE